MKQGQKQSLPARPKTRALQMQETAAQHAPTVHQPVAAHSLHDLPAEPSARALRQSTMLQMQQARGNAFVQRQILDGDTANAAEPAPESQADTGAGQADNELSADGSTVSVGAGGVNITGGMVNVSAALTNVSGVLSADTLLANNVISSSYSPGAGNLM